MGNRVHRRGFIGISLFALAGCATGAGIVGPDGRRSASGIIPSGRFGVNLAGGSTVTPGSEPGREIGYTLRGDRTRAGSPVYLVLIAKDDRLSRVNSVRVAGGPALAFVAPEAGGRNPFGATSSGFALTADVPPPVYRAALRNGLTVELASPDGVSTLAIPPSHFADFDVAWQQLLAS